MGCSEGITPASVCSSYDVRSIENEETKEEKITKKPKYATVVFALQTLHLFKAAAAASQITAKKN